MPAKITTLISGPDTFELVRDQLAAILLVESAAQQVLAAAALENPDLWKLRVFTERSAPWEEWLRDVDADGYDPTPLVNISLDSVSYIERSSNTIGRQAIAVTYNIDCYGQGVSRETDAGHDPGDEAAAFEAQRAYRLVRNILMAGTYTYLDMRGTVGKRFPQGLEAFQPPIDAQNVTKVVAVRWRLVVEMVETSPQVEGQPLETIHAEVTRTETNEVLLEATFDHTPDP